MGLLVSASSTGAATIVNGTFDADVSGWNPTSQVSIAWSPLDPDDPTPSGSIEVTSSTPNGADAGPSQCVSLAGPSPELLRAYVLVPDDPGDWVRAEIVVWYYASPACMDFLELDFSPDWIGEGTGWTELAMPLSVPPAAASMRVQLAAVRESDGGSSVAYFDAVTLPEPGVAAGIAAAGALLCLARTRS